MVNLSGRALGRYQLLECLGSGGMAQVYRARDPLKGTAVAVKVLYPHLTADEGFTARFQREAEAAALLDHPHIIRILDHGSDDGLSYLVMELIDGPSLETVLRQRDEPLSPDEAVRLVATLADALDYAHRQGVVHRDVKPSNILLRGGRLDDPVLTDFGVARIIDATLATAPGTLLGTPTYMSPEQGEGQTGDARSDIYALGIVLYELVTGQPPFQADSPYALILRHIHTPPSSPHTLQPDLSPGLEEAIMRALAKDPVERYPTAVAFASALTRRAAARSRWHVLAYAISAVVLLFLVGVFAAWHLGWLPVGTRSSGKVIAAKATPVVLTLQGGPAITGTWLDPDVPDRPAIDDPKVHLQGPSTPDRLVYRLKLPEISADTGVLSATLSLYTVPWGEDNRYATVVLHRLLRDWDPATATYSSPWSSPGLQAGVDYEAEPFLTMTLDELLHNEGWLDLDITLVVRDWLAGQPNYGLMVRTTDDSFGMAHFWVYTGGYDDPDLWPKLALVYQ